MKQNLKIEDIVLSDKAIQEISNLQERNNEILISDLIQLTELLSLTHFNQDDRSKNFTDFIISIIDFYRALKA